MENSSISELELEEIEKWLNSYKLPRSYKKLSRDFNDGVLIANVIKLEFPKMVDLHNYPSSSSYNQKFCNWETLNRKVLMKLGMNLSLASCGNLARGDNQEMIRFLLDLKNKIKLYKVKKSDKNDLIGGGSCPAVMIQNHEMSYENAPQELKSLKFFEEMAFKYEEKLKEIESLKKYIFQLEKKLHRQNEEIKGLKIQKALEERETIYYD